MEAYKALTYLTEAEVNACLKRFTALLHPKTVKPLVNLHDQQVSHEHIIEGLQDLRVTPSRTASVSSFQGLTIL